MSASRSLAPSTSFGQCVFVLLLALGLFPAFSQAQPTVAGDPSTVGTLLVKLAGPMDAPLAGARVEADGVSAVTDDTGTAKLSLRVATHGVLLRVPKALLPLAPTNEEEWRVSVPDVEVIAAAETVLDVGLSESGGFVRLEVRVPSPEVPVRNMQEEHAQAIEKGGTGRVQGVITAAADESPVEGAHVFVRGAPLETKADAGGRYSLSLPAGTHQLWVIHPDFSTQSLTKIEVRAGATVEANAALAPRAPNEEWLITAPHIEGGIASMIAERRETTAVADVIGSEQMSRSGASNAASALSRVTGLTIVDGKYVIVRGMGERYSNLLVNRLQVPSPDPGRRVVPLDLFPAGILESVTVQKSYSPDMPGEFGGGMVQIRTRTYPDKFTLNLSLGTGGNQQSMFKNRLSSEGGNADFLGIDDGTRGLPEAFDDPRGRVRREGVRGGGYPQEEIEALARSLPNNFKTTRSRTPPDLIMSASVGDKFRLRVADLGYIAAVGYKTEYSTIRYDALRKKSAVDGNPFEEDYNLRQYRRQISLNGFLDWGVEFSKAHKLKFTSIFLRQTDDDTYLRGGTEEDQGPNRFTRLGWVERQVGSQQVNGSHTFAKLADFQVDWRYAFSRATRKEPDRRDIEYASGDSDVFTILPSGFERLYAKANDGSHEGQIDLIKPLPIWRGLTAKLKGGALAYARDRDSRVRRFTYDIAGSAFPDLTLPPEQLFDPNGVAPSRFYESTNDSDGYKAKMNIFAGYAMTEIPLHKRFDLMAGARAEKATIDVDTFDQFNAGEPIRASLDNFDVLPAATVTYRMPKDFQLRGGYSRTLNRPDFRELSTSQYFDVELNAELRGSSTLKRARIDNFDARLEWYYTTDEIFSVGGFVKMFDSPIESVRLPAPGTLFSFANADSAYSYGFEVEGRKRLEFIASALESMFVSSNVTIIRSEVDVANGPSRPMASQSPYVLNVQLGWDDTGEGRSGTSVSLLYNVYGKRLRIVGDSSTGALDIYEHPFHSLDLVASQDLKHGFKVGLRLRNLVNSRIRWTEGGVTVRDARRGADGQINVSWSY